MLNVLPSQHIEADTYVDRLHQEFDQLGGSGRPVVGLFSGGGGLDLGFAAAGFDLCLSSDIVPEYCETLRGNLLDHTATPIDVSKVDYSVIRESIGNRELSGIVGGPPCQSFSILGSRGSVNDPRGALVYNYISIIKELRPEFFLFENVPGLKTVNKGQDWKDILAAFRESTGYEIHTKQLNSVAYGVAQKRERVFIVGFRDAGKVFKWPEPTHGDPTLGTNLLLPPTVKEAFLDLDGTTNNDKRVHGERVYARYSTIKPGDRDRTDHTDRLDPNKPSGVVLVGSGGGGGRPFIHPWEHRHITVREAARLQSFPDWWTFSGGVTKQYRQVGNAVPPLLGKAVATSIMDALTK